MKLKGLNLDELRNSKRAIEAVLESFPLVARTFDFTEKEITRDVDLMRGNLKAISAKIKKELRNGKDKIG